MNLGEGFSAVIETVEAGLGAPDPQKLAEMTQMAFKIKGETSDSEDGQSKAKTTIFSRETNAKSFQNLKPR